VKVTIDIHDELGNLVRRLDVDKSNRKAGDQEVSWDGKNAKGAAMPTGVYTFTVSAMDATGQSMPVETFIQGKIQGVEYDQNQAYLLIDGNRVEFNSLANMR
jgi:flagellar basal-body rod modification protein FlgD